MTHRHLVFIVCVLGASLTACGGGATSDDGGGGASNTSQGGTGDQTSASNTSQGGTTGGTTGGGTTGGGTTGGGGDLPDDPEAAMLTPELESDRPLSELTTPELELLCLAHETFLQTLSVERKLYECLAIGVDAGQVGNDPALTCERLSGACVDLVELQAMFPDLAPEPSVASCMFDMSQRVQQPCTDPTVAEYKACVLRNLELQTDLLDRRELTCAEAVELVSIRPQGTFDCACGVEARIGPVPEGDEDWDSVPDEDDICPGSETYYVVTEYGCSEVQDRDLDRVWDEEDLCLNTARGAPEVSAAGCSRAQDDDFDDLPDGVDPCPGTADGAEQVTPGCSLAQDEDADGVGNLNDWCPFTPEGEVPDQRGCAEGQGEPWNEPYLDEVPEGTEVVVLGTDQEGPIELHVLPGGVSGASAQGFDYSGTLVMAMGDGRYMQLPGSEVSFELEDGVATNMVGVTVLPFPGVGLFEGFRPEPLIDCQVGFVPGSSEEFVSRGLPVVPTRKYMLVACEGRFAADLGPIHLSLPPSADLVMALDPFDPAFYLKGDVRGVRPFDAVNDVALAFSAQGNIPFEPAQTWGVEDIAEPFGAHMYGFINVPIPLNNYLVSELLDLEVEGDLFVNLDPNGDGPVDFGDTDVRFGANGVLRERVSFFGIFDLTAEMSEATIGGTLDPRGDTTVYASGVAGPDSIEFFIELPIVQIAEARVASVLSTTPGRSRFLAETWFRLHSSELNLPLIPELFDIDIEGSVTADDEGIRLLGVTSGQLHPWFDARGESRVEVYLSWDLNRYFIHLQGAFEVGGDFIDGFSATDIYLGDDDVRFDDESAFRLLF